MSVPIAALAVPLFAVAGAVEYRLHRARLDRIPVRIHVNGTRGKSSVTRLIAAGLAAGGIRTLGKTTGTAPNLILPDGSREAIRRRGPARISEQMAVVRRAAALGARALVVECMALGEENQRVSERMLLRSTIGVITNARADHRDVMGPDAGSVARVLANSIPAGGTLVAGPGVGIDIFTSACNKYGTRLVVSDPESVSPAEMRPFGYTSFPGNVAIALDVCALCGVDRAVALAGMYAALPDPGVRPVYRFESDGRVRFTVVDGFAANDPESTMKMWERYGEPERTGSAGASHSGADRTVVVVNHREDRPWRVAEMAEFIGRIRPDLVLYVGELGTLALGSTHGGVAASALRRAAPAAVIGRAAEGLGAGARVLMFLAGNVKGAGAAVADYVAALAAGGAA